MASAIDDEDRIACTADLLNSWAREIGVAQCDNPFNGLSLRDLADRLWSCNSARIYEAERKAYSCVVSLDAIRDAVLHGRYQLAEMDVDPDVINAVLGIIDDHWPGERLSEDVGR